MARTQPPTPITSLFPWLEALGARFPGAAPGRVPGMGTGLLATRKLGEEDPILFVPRDVWFTRKSAHTRHRPTVDTEETRSLFSHSMSRLALLLALEHATPDSFFRVYLDQLGNPTVPYELTAPERSAIQGLPLETWIDEQRAQTESECADLRAALRTLYPNVVTAQALDLPLWQWAYGHVMQRTFSVDVDDEEVWVLVPGMDLCNHAEERNALFFAEEDGWYLEASRSIEPGEQITIRYGRAKTSSDLLLYYGFVTPRNPSDRLQLKLELSERDPDRPEKRAAIDLLGLRTDTLIGLDGMVPSSFLHAAVLWGMDSATFRADHPSVADPRLAMRALERVAAAITHALADYPTSVEHDAAEVERLPCDGWLRALVTYRLNVKRLHRDAAAAIRRRIEDIAAHGWRPEEIVEEDLDGRYGLATVTVPVDARPSTPGSGETLDI